MKRHTVAMTLSLGVAALLATPAQAQNRGFGFFGGGGGGLMLLTNQGVQKELKLDSQQTEKVEQVAKDIREKHASDFENIRGLDPAERRDKMTELNKTITAEVDKALADALKPEQTKRFSQIRLQQYGLQAFADSKVQEKLNLTDGQKNKIRGIEEDSREKMREIFQNAGGDPQEKAAAGRKFMALRKESLEKALGVFTSEQKTTWKELTGEPFEVQFQRRGN
jgi:Spy/CpxP family protein refolding chaperone